MTTSRFVRLPRLFTLALAAALAAGCAADPLTDADLATEADEIGRRPTFELVEDAAGEHRFEFVASNGAVLLSSEGYATRTGALNGLLSVLDNGGIASRYEVVPTGGGRAYFQLHAANRQVIARSDEYAQTWNARRGVDATIRAVSAYLEHWDQATGARFAVREDAGGMFYTSLYAGNGELVLRTQRYQTEASALNAAFAIAELGVDAARYDVRQAASGGWYFNLVAANGQVVGTSEVYASKSNAERGRNAIIALLPTVELL